MTSNDRAFVATRKGLFELRRRSGTWQIERMSFLGEPVSMLLPQADGFMLAALNLGHFGVKVHARAMPARPGRRSRRRRSRRSPTAPRGPAVEAGADLVARRGRVRHDLGRHAARRPVPLARPWPLVAARRVAVVAARAPGVVRRRLRRAGHPLICPHPRRAGELLVGISCGGAWITRDDGASWALGPGHARRLHAARAGRQPEHPGPAPCARRSPRRCGASITAASGARPTARRAGRR